MLNTMNELLQCTKTYPNCYFLIFHFFFVLLPSSPSVPDFVKLLLSLIGKMTMTASYHLAWVYTLELFSTSNRARVVGEASILSRLSTVSVPYFNDLLVGSLMMLFVELFI